MNSADDTKFRRWMKEVNKALLNAVDMEVDDLPDWNYYDEFIGGTTPSVAAKRVIANAKGDY
jgi:hypothetical protein